MHWMPNTHYTWELVVCIVKAYSKGAPPGYTVSCVKSYIHVYVLGIAIMWLQKRLMCVQPNFSLPW